MVGGTREKKEGSQMNQDDDDPGSGRRKGQDAMVDPKESPRIGARMAEVQRGW